MEELEALKSFSNSLESMDKFMDSYSKMLNSAWNRRDFNEIWGLQKVLFMQTEFIFNEYIKLITQVTGGEIQ